MFKVGDKVKRSYDCNDGVYTVERVVWNRGWPEAKLTLNECDGEYWISRFELVEQKQEQSTSQEMILPEDSILRKNIPLATGLLDYFPLALAAVSNASLQGNEQHHPGTPLKWDKDKSTDHADCIMRHLADRGKFDTDGIRHSVKLAWRALALAQIELEESQKRGEEIFKAIKKG